MEELHGFGCWLSFTATYLPLSRFFYACDDLRNTFNHLDSFSIILHKWKEKKIQLFFPPYTKFSWTCFCQATKISHWDRRGVSSLRTCPHNCVWNLPQLKDLLHFRLKYWGQIRAEYLEGLHSHWCCSQEASCMGNGIFTSIQPPPPSGPTEFSTWYSHHEHFWKNDTFFCRDCCPIATIRTWDLLIVCSMCPLLLPQISLILVWNPCKSLCTKGLNSY